MLFILGPVNSFRRSELKRPTYAKVPGLSGSTSNNSLPAGSTTPSYFPAFSPQAVSSILPPLVPQPSLSPASSTSSIQDVTFALNSQFKPINPQPPSFPAVKPNIPQPQHSTHSINLGPVMDAIPANEALPRPPNETDNNSTLAAKTVSWYRPLSARNQERPFRYSPARPTDLFTITGSLRMAQKKRAHGRHFPPWILLL